MDSNKKKIDVKVSEQFVTKILTGNEIPFTFDTVEKLKICIGMQMAGANTGRI